MRIIKIQTKLLRILREANIFLPKAKHRNFAYRDRKQQITVMGAAYLMVENAAIIGIGLREVLLFLSLVLALVQVYVDRTKLPKLWFILVLTISIRLFIGFSQIPQPAILLMLVLIFGFMILGGGLISNFVPETPRGLCYCPSYGLNLFTLLYSLLAESVNQFLIVKRII